MHGKIIKKRRQQMDITQRELADVIGISQNYLCNLESRIIPKKYLFDLCYALKIDPETGNGLEGNYKMDYLSRQKIEAFDKILAIIQPLFNRK